MENIEAEKYEKDKKFKAQRKFKVLYKINIYYNYIQNSNVLL